jgi:glycosyltransferase involved in cell wall biosynthesis
MATKVAVFCPTLNVCGGGEFVAIAIANTLAQNNYKVIIFSNGEVNPNRIKKYFGETLDPSIQTIKQPSRFTSRGLADFYQTIFHSYIAKSKCNLFIDAFTNCIFPWTNISYIHFPYLNQHTFNKRFPYIGLPRFSPVGTIPHVIIEKNLANYDNKLVLANSYYTASEIRKYSEKSVEVLYPPFPSSISAIGKETYKMEKDNLVVTISRFDSNKLLERILLIAAQCNPKIRFAVIGRLCNPETLAYLQVVTKRLGLTNRVKFYPDASAETKNSLLKKAKIYLHTMVGEHFGISIVEAMAFGCLPVVHNSGGMVEFVPAQYRYETVQEATDSVINAVNSWSPDKSEEMMRIAENFSIASFSNRFMTLFSKYYTSD